MFVHVKWMHGCASTIKLRIIMVINAKTKIEWGSKINHAKVDGVSTGDCAVRGQISKTVSTLSCCQRADPSSWTPSSRVGHRGDCEIVRALRILLARHLRYQPQATIPVQEFSRATSWCRRRPRARAAPSPLAYDQQSEHRAMTKRSHMPTWNSFGTRDGARWTHAAFGPSELGLDECVAVPSIGGRRSRDARWRWCHFWTRCRRSWRFRSRPEVEQWGRCIAVQGQWCAGPYHVVDGCGVSDDVHLVRIALACRSCTSYVVINQHPAINSL